MLQSGAKKIERDENLVVIKPSEFRKLLKAEQDQIFREQAAYATEMYLTNPNLLVAD
jgi:hypothetical protein